MTDLQSHFPQLHSHNCSLTNFSKNIIQMMLIPCLKCFNHFLLSSEWNLKSLTCFPRPFPALLPPSPPNPLCSRVLPALHWLPAPLPSSPELFWPPGPISLCEENSSLPSARNAPKTSFWFQVRSYYLPWSLLWTPNVLSPVTSGQHPTLNSTMWATFTCLTDLLSLPFKS